MFTIIGGDGKEYGPVTLDQVRAWITAGRANLDTKVRPEGSTEWRRVGDLPEFGGGSGLPPVVDPASPPVVNPFTAPNPTATPASTLVPADVGVRLGSRVIDWAVAMLGVLPGIVVFGGEMFKMIAEAGQGRQPDLENMDLQRVGLGAMILGAGWLIVLVVQIVLLSTRGQSIGKLCTGIRVVRVENGAKAGFVHGWLLRECLITVIGVVLGVIPFIGPLLLRPALHITDWCLIFRGDQRCLHDLIAGTRVVKGRPPR